MTARAPLPTQPPGVTLSPVSRLQAREDLALKKTVVVLKMGDELWSVFGDRRLVEAYAKHAKSTGWTVVKNHKGIVE